MPDHLFEATGSWKGGLKGKGLITVNGVEHSTTVPANMGGMGGGTNPEELFAATAAKCQLITLAAILEFKRITVQQINIRTTASYALTPMGPVLKRIDHFPTVQAESQTQDLIKQIEESFGMAEVNCLVSKAVKGNVVVSVSGKFVSSRTPTNDR